MKAFAFVVTLALAQLCPPASTLSPDCFHVDFPDPQFTIRNCHNVAYSCDRTYFFQQALPNLFYCSMGAWRHPEEIATAYKNVIIRLAKARNPNVAASLEQKFGELNGPARSIRCSKDVLVVPTGLEKCIAKESSCTESMANTFMCFVEEGLQFHNQGIRNYMICQMLADFYVALRTNTTEPLKEIATDIDKMKCGDRLWRERLPAPRRPYYGDY